MSRDSLFMELETQGYNPSSVRGIYGAGSELASGDVSYVGGYREATATDIFGDGSVLGSYKAVAPMEPTLIDGWLFQLLVVAGLVAYLYMILRSWHFMGSIWMGVLYRGSERRMRDEGGEIPLERFKLSTSLLGVVLMALVVVRLIDMSISADAAFYHSDSSVVAPIYAMLVTLLFVVWYYVLHKVIDVITRLDVMHQLASVAMMNFVRTIVIAYPLVSIWLLSPAAMLHTWSIVLGVVMSAMLVIYLKDTFILFVGKKISILNWILYLCAAILLPLSFICRVIPQIVG